MHGDYFGDKSKYKNAVSEIKNNIYEFNGYTDEMFEIVPAVRSVNIIVQHYFINFFKLVGWKQVKFTTARLTISAPAI